MATITAPAKPDLLPVPELSYKPLSPDQWKRVLDQVEAQIAAGTIIPEPPDVPEAPLATESAQVVDAFQRLYPKPGPVGTALSEAARRVAQGEEVERVLDAIDPEIRAAVEAALREALTGHGQSAGGSVERQGAQGTLKPSPPATPEV